MLFREIQENQYPEFLGDFGKMRGFMPGKTLSQTPSQILNLQYGIQQLEKSGDMGAIFPDDVKNVENALKFVNSGGWNYLAFLEAMKKASLRGARSL